MACFLYWSEACVGAEREGGDGERDQQGAEDDGTRRASGRHQDQVSNRQNLTNET